MTSQVAGFGLEGTPEFKTYLRVGSPPGMLIVMDGETSGARLDLSPTGLAPLRAQMGRQGEIRNFTVRPFPGIGTALEAEFVAEGPNGGEATAYLLAASHGDRTFVMSYIVFGAAGDPGTWGELSAGVRFGRGALLNWLLIGGGAIVGLGALFLLVGRLRQVRTVAPRPVSPSFIRPMLDPAAYEDARRPGPGPGPRGVLPTPTPTPAGAGVGATPAAAPPGLRPTLGHGAGHGAPPPPPRKVPKPGPGMGLRSTLPPSGEYGR